MQPGRVLAGLTLILACVSAGPPGPPPPEVSSELGDLWRDRDAFFLRVDSRTPRPAGIAPKGTKQIVVRTEAMARGRPYPGRWTAVEVELRSAEAQLVQVGYVSDTAVPIKLPPGHWVPVRLPLPKELKDVAITPGGQTLEFRKVKLVDDRWEIWKDGWSIRREAAMVQIKPRKGSVISIPANGVEFEEVGPLRAIVNVEGKRGTIYASGKIFGDIGLSVSPTTQTPLNINIIPDMGRLDRQSEGDADGDGFNELRGATLLKVATGGVNAGSVGRRVVFGISSLTGVNGPILEIAGLASGEVTVLWEGKLITTHDRLASGVVLLEIPAMVGDKMTQVEVSVSAK